MFEDDSDSGSTGGWSSAIGDIFNSAAQVASVAISNQDQPQYQPGFTPGYGQLTPGVGLQKSNSSLLLIGLVGVGALVFLMRK